MNTLDITRVSAKGQVVIPNSIRASLGIKSGAKLAVITDGENILMKPLETPKLETFRKLITDSRAYARRAGLKRSDVAKTIRKVRDADRSGH